MAHGKLGARYMKKKINVFRNRFIEKDSEEKQLMSTTNQITPALKEIWDNEKDKIYNDL